MNTNSLIQIAKELGLKYDVEIKFFSDVNRSFGCYDHFSGTIELNLVAEEMEGAYNRTDAQITKTLAHELGHAIDIQNGAPVFQLTYIELENRADAIRDQILVSL
jgi:hypothetical protein